MDLPLLAGIHRYIQGSGVTSFETHLDEFSAIPMYYKDGGPQVRLVNECRRPELANVGQLRKVVQAVSGAWRCDELEDFEEYFDGDFVSGPPFSWASVSARLRCKVDLLRHPLVRC